MLKNDLIFSFRVLVRPIDSFWDLKHEKKGRLYIAALYIVLWFFTNIVEKTVLSFQFNFTYNQQLDIFKELRPVILLFLLFCISNWSITTLMDGKGFFKDIVMVFGYASLPLTLIRIPTVIISNFATPEEGVFINSLLSISFVWFLVLLFIGTMQIHEYSFSKTVFTSALTIFSMLVLVFISMIFYTIFAQIIQFCMMFYRELLQRF